MKEDKHFNLNTYFRPIELTNIIEQIANQEYLHEPGNSKMIICNKELQMCFFRWNLFVPDLYALCKEHVYVVDPEKTEEIKNQYINCEMYIDSPKKIIYKDPTSRFWLHPFLNQILNANEHITYTWTALCTMFVNFVNAPNNHIECNENSICSINPQSELVNIFAFQTFHKSQIPAILKQVTLFLGKSNSLSTLCPYLQFDDQMEDVIKFIEYIILSNNNLTPFISQNIHI